MTHTPGAKDTPPNFDLQDADGKPHALSDYAGRPVVLVFYAGDMTPGCSLQLCSLSDAWPRLTAADAAVMAINQAPAQSHDVFRTKCHFPFPLLIDKRNKIAAAYGATYTLFGLSLVRRTVVVIGRNGKIAYYHHGMPKTADILKAVENGASLTA